jgi:amino acid efflux transporter
MLAGICYHYALGERMGQKNPARLDRTLTLAPAVGLAITMVVGSGLLVLPGIAYRQVGAAALYAWLISAVATLPIIVILARLGARFPDASGIAGFVQAAFGQRLGLATEILILSTLPGGAAIAITGGQYFAACLGGDRTWVIAGALITLAIGAGVNYFGAQVSGRVQQWLAAGLVILLAGVALLALLTGIRAGTGIAPPARWIGGIPAVSLVFFAFVGWELMSFTSEEFAHPARDFPLMMGISFIVVLALYALVAVAIQMVLPLADVEGLNAPVVALLSSAFGALSGRIVAGLGFLIVLANFVGVVWAFSRLGFASARNGLLPASLGQLSAATRTPRAATMAVVVAFAGLMIAYFLGLVTHALLFELAGAGFFLAYVLAALADAKLARKPHGRFFGISVAIILSVVYASFGLRAIYPLVAVGFGYLIGRWRVSPPAQVVSEEPPNG